MLFRHSLAMVMALGVAMVTPLAQAEDVPELAPNSQRSTILIELHDTSSDVADVGRRIAAELRAAGFQVELVQPRAAPIDPAANPGLVARIVVAEAQPAPRVSVQIEAAKQPARVVEADGVQSDLAPSVLAVRTVELLRASLVELVKDPAQRQAMPSDVMHWLEESTTPDPAPLVAAPPIAQALPQQAPAERFFLPAVLPYGPDKVERMPDGWEPKAPRPSDYDKQLWLGGGFASVISGGSLGLSFGPRFKLRKELPYSFSLGGDVILAGPVHGVAAQSIQVVAMGEASYAFGTTDSVVSPYLSASLGIHVYRSTQLAQLHSLSQPGNQAGLAFAVASGPGLRFEMASWAHFLIEVAALIVVPEPIIVDTIGPGLGAHFPMMTSSLGLELSPP